MYNVEITPNELCGEIIAPPSKSMAHRLLIGAALAKGESTISGLSFSKDIIATIDALKALGAKIHIKNDIAVIEGINKSAEKSDIFCNESGSTLRFLIPIAAALGVNATFKGEGKLPQRPITPYLTQLSHKGIVFDYNNTMPFSISGQLLPGEYEMAGDVSSQFITGLLFALPLLEGDSKLTITSKLESRPYVDLTVSALRKFGITITECENAYFIKGNQNFKCNNVYVEGDYSQAAFFYVANALGCKIKLKNLDEQSLQGDKKIIEIINKVCYNNKRLIAFEVDGSDIPDIVPILTVLACFCEGESRIYNVARLRIKESDRLEAISSCLNKLGGRVIATEDSLIIQGVPYIRGGEVDSFNDHRIAMSMAIAAIRCHGVIQIKNASCVEKSYPNFFEEYKKLGGVVNVINLE